MIYNFAKGYNDDRAIESQKRPIIAISANIIDELSTLHFAYSQAVMDAGGVPIIIPANCDAQSLHSLMRGVDGVLLSGGADIDARYFGEENIPDLTDLDWRRDLNEFAMLRAAIDRNLPILGICRGCQVINIALGGSIYQDLPSQYEAPLNTHFVLTDKHLPVHDVEIVEGSKLHKIVGATSIGVNSRHHQAVKSVAPSLRVSARSKDGVVEGVENRQIVAVQWHPENMATEGGREDMKRLFGHFVGEADLYRRAKWLHTNNITVDSHCDTPMLYDEGGFDFSIRNSGARVDSVKMEEGYLDATITVAYIPQSTPRDEATHKALSTLKRFREDIEGSVVVARCVSDIVEAKAVGRRTVMLAVENGLAIGDDLTALDRFKEEGVVYVTLCHNGSNAICDSAKGEAPHGGVSAFGALVVERMNSLGITVDISHSSESSTMDAIRLSKQPIIASHSSCRALCDHPRNLTDETIRAIAASGGVVQICAYGGFLKDADGATIHDLVAHIEHVISLTGYNHVGIGSDFDGGGGVEGFDGANDFMSVTIELLRNGHSSADVAKIMGGNILRVLSENSNI